MNYREILNALVKSIKNRDGPEQIDNIEKETRKLALQAMYREGILQILAREKFWNRLKFLGLYPELILPYLSKIKNKK